MSTCRACAGGWARRRLLLDLHARYGHRSRSGEAFAHPDRSRAQSRRAAPERDRARDDGGGGACRAQGGKVRRADGDGRRAHDRRQPRRPARLPAARRPLPHALAQREHELERFLGRHAEAQRPHRLRQGRRPRAEPPRHARRHLARVRQDVLGRDGDEQGAARRVALVAAIDLRPSPQHDRRHDPRARRQGRRDHDQLLAQLPLRRAAIRPVSRTCRWPSGRPSRGRRSSSTSTTPRSSSARRTSASDRTSTARPCPTGWTTCRCCRRSPRRCSTRATANRT